MSTELTLLAWCSVLAVVQILLPSILRTQETGPDYNASPRDVPSRDVASIVSSKSSTMSFPDWAALSRQLPSGLVELVPYACFDGSDHLEDEHRGLQAR